MSDYTVAQAQSDMRTGYLCGAPGVFVSAMVWLAAAGAALSHTPKGAMWTLLVGGAFIHPASLLLTRLLGGPGKHTEGNPLGWLALEGTVWFIAGIAIAFGLHVLRVEWFFPAMLLLIGGRYLTFQSIYGLRVYWLLGAALCSAGIALALGRAPVHVTALTGGVVELAFAVTLFARAKGTG